MDLRQGLRGSDVAHAFRRASWTLREASTCGFPRNLKRNPQAEACITERLSFRSFNLLLGRFDNFFHRETKMLLQRFDRRGRPKRVHADAVPGHAHIARPAEC